MYFPCAEHNTIRYHVGAAADLNGELKNWLLISVDLLLKFHIKYTILAWKTKIANRSMVLKVLQLKSIVCRQRNRRLLIALQSIAKPEKTIIIRV